MVPSSALKNKSGPASRRSNISAITSDREKSRALPFTDACQQRPRIAEQLFAVGSGINSNNYGLRYDGIDDINSQSINQNGEPSNIHYGPYSMQTESAPPWTPETLHYVGAQRYTSQGSRLVNGTSYVNTFHGEPEYPFVSPYQFTLPPVPHPEHTFPIPSYLTNGFPWSNDAESGIIGSSSWTDAYLSNASTQGSDSSGMYSQSAFQPGLEGESFAEISNSLNENPGSEAMYYIQDANAWQTGVSPSTSMPSSSPSQSAPPLPLPRLEPRPKAKSKLLIECEHCGTTCARESDLVRHLMTHGKKFYECRVCRARYSRKDKITEHCRNKHGQPRGGGELYRFVDEE